ICRRRQEVVRACDRVVGRHGESCVRSCLHPPAPTAIYTLSHTTLFRSRAHEYMLYQALLGAWPLTGIDAPFVERMQAYALHEGRSEEHTSELQSRRDLVCRLLLEKKNRRGRRVRHASKHGRGVDEPSIG